MRSMAVMLVESFWALMATNDFRSVGSVLGDEFVLEWPQSKERIRGRDKFAAMNEEYPRHGRWEFTINRIVGNDDEAVSDVWVMDGVQKARALSFFSVRDGIIVKIVEFWPEDYPAHENRKHLVEQMDSYKRGENNCGRPAEVAASDHARTGPAHRVPGREGQVPVTPNQHLTGERS